jgi:phenylacetate-CoA ligase
MTFADIRKVPLTDKEELRRYQEIEPYPYGGILGGKIEEVTTFRQTSGTTGKPVYVPETYESWQWRTEAWCHILYMAGFRPHHRVFLPFGYNVYVAFWEGHSRLKMDASWCPNARRKGRIQDHRNQANAMMTPQPMDSTR